jgi:tight adherence protein B
MANGILSNIAFDALLVFAGLFLLFGVWLLLGQRASSRTRVEVRLKGVRQIKKYELGDSLAQTRERESKKREHRKEVLRQKAYSDIPALNNALKQASWADRLSGMLLQAQVPVNVTSFVMICGLLAAMGVAVSVLWRRHLDPLLGLLFGGVLGLAPMLFVFLKVRMRLRRFGSQLADALDLLSSSVKGGQSLNAAVQNVADEMPDPIADEFKILADELTFGVTFDDALQHLTTRVNTADVRFFASALMIQKETGGSLAEVLDGLQKTIRERFRILGQVKTLTAQGKLSGIIVGALPIALCVLIYFLNPAYMRDLFVTPVGQKMLIGGVSLQLLGVFVIYRIVNIKV